MCLAYQSNDKGPRLTDCNLKLTNQYQGMKPYTSIGVKLWNLNKSKLSYQIVILIEWTHMLSNSKWTTKS